MTNQIRIGLVYNEIEKAAKKRDCINWVYMKYQTE